MDKIKVVWLTHFSNQEIQNHLKLKRSLFDIFYALYLHEPLTTKVTDFAVWISNAIKEVEKSPQIELHLVCPYPHVNGKIQSFEHNGVYYHFFKNEYYSICGQIKDRFLYKNGYTYKKNRKIIAKIIKTINPNIVHLFGAENPCYSLALLDVPKTIPTIVQLTTLMNDDDFFNNYNGDVKQFIKRANFEKKIILKSEYIGTTAVKYKKIILESIKPEATIIDTSLALGVPINDDLVEKEYDFVYFASNISKAVDIALEAFRLAHVKDETITLDVIGSYNETFKQNLDSFIEKHGLKNCVKFEGRLNTHEDVIQQIKKSRVALLPLRIDLTSGTIRESLANGLPVITTDTGEMGTRKLNKDRETVAICDMGDFQAMANIMLKINTDQDYYNKLKQNGYFMAENRISNKEVVGHYFEVYHSILISTRVS